MLLLMGMVNNAVGKYDSALDYYKRALETFNKNKPDDSGDKSDDEILLKNEHNFEKFLENYIKEFIQSITNDLN